MGDEHTRLRGPTSEVLAEPVCASVEGPAAPGNSLGGESAAPHCSAPREGPGLGSAGAASAYMVCFIFSTDAGGGDGAGAPTCAITISFETLDPFDHKGHSWMNPDLAPF